MDISKPEQRVLHILAQGGHITVRKTDNGRIEQIECYTREGWRTDRCDLLLFRKLKRKRAIRSQGGRPYRITRRGLELVRPEVDNR